MSNFLKTNNTTRRSSTRSAARSRSRSRSRSISRSRSRSISKNSFKSKKKILNDRFTNFQKDNITKDYALELFDTSVSDYNDLVDDYNKLVKKNQIINDDLKKMKNKLRELHEVNKVWINEVNDQFKKFFNAWKREMASRIKL